MQMEPAISTHAPKPKRKLGWREKRLMFYLAVLLGVLAWKFVPRPWRPALTIETVHYSIASTATRQHTEEMGRMVELLYDAYSNRFSTLPKFQRDHPKLKVLLYKDRAEMRRVNPGLGWAEAFYRKPYCRAYFSAEEQNPYHWMLHEATHQLNTEVAHVELAKWLEEGIAEYFSTSRIISNKLAVGTIDPNTYPVWWHEEIAKTPNVASNLANRSVIPLRAIVTNRRGPSTDRNVNLYYLHWWALTHFVFEDKGHRENATKLFESGGGGEAFERFVGAPATVQPEWHAHVRKIKATVEGHDVNFFRTGRLPE
jgi:hypothetical protein